MDRGNRLTTLVMVAICALVVALTTFVDRADAAESLAGCDGKYRKMASDWNQRTFFGQAVLLPRPHSEARPVNHNSNLIYWYCPNGKKDNKVMGLKWDHCHFLPEGGSNFDGVWYEPYLYTSGDKDVNLDRKFVKEGKKADYYQHCEDQIIPLKKRKWMKMEDFPRWNIWSRIRREGAIPDEGRVNWDTAQGGVQFIKPGTDFKITPWRND